MREETLANTTEAENAEVRGQLHYPKCRPNAVSNRFPVPVHILQSRVHRCWFQCTGVSSVLMIEMNVAQIQSGLFLLVSGQCTSVGCLLA